MVKKGDFFFMPTIKYREEEIHFNIVYYGPGLSGKTTNLLYIHESLPKSSAAEMFSLNTIEERTLYFDYMPLEFNKTYRTNYFSVRTHVFTVPGQSQHDATRRVILRGVDGIVYVADSQRHMMAENIRMLNNLRANLKAAWSQDLDKIPLVFQFNKRDLDDISRVEDLVSALCLNGEPYFEAVAITGHGVVPTITKLYDLVVANTPLLPKLPVGEQRQEARS